MKNNIILAPSLLAADFSIVGKQLAEIKEGGAEYIHLDVMDGLFVPNISFGTPVIKSLRKCTDLFFDVHLMIDRPERYINDYVGAGANLITFHYEATENPRAVLEQIKAAGVNAAISVKPGTPVEVLSDLLPLCDMVLIMTVEPGFGGQKFMADMMPKVKKLREMLNKVNPACHLEVDGGVDLNTVKECKANGANVFVAGSAYFGAADKKAFTEEIKK